MAAAWTLAAGLLAQEIDGSGLGEALEGTTWEDWVIAGAVVVGAVVIGRLVKGLVLRVLRRDGETTFVMRLVARFAQYAVIMVGFIYALGAIGVSLVPLLGALGVAGIALAFALQDILENFVAGIILLLRRPFEVGDQVATSGYDGTVEDVNLRAVALRQFDGTTVYVPNADVLDSPIVNHTQRGVRRTTIDIGVSYDTDLDAAQGSIVDAVAGMDGVLEDPPPEAYVHEFGDSSINFAVRFWHDPQIATVWRVRDRVARALKRRLDDEGIDIPFPQRTLHVGAPPVELAMVGGPTPVDSGTGTTRD